MALIVKEDIHKQSHDSGKIEIEEKKFCRRERIGPIKRI